MPNSRTPIDSNHRNGEENPYEAPASQSDFARVSILRVFYGLFAGAVVGGVSFCTTCGGIGFIGVMSLGPYSDFVPGVLAIAYIVGGIISFWLFIKVYRAIVAPGNPKKHDRLIEVSR